MKNGRNAYCFFELKTWKIFSLHDLNSCLNNNSENDVGNMHVVFWLENWKKKKSSLHVLFLVDNMQFFFL